MQFNKSFFKIAESKPNYEGVMPAIVEEQVAPGPAPPKKHLTDEQKLSELTL